MTIESIENWISKLKYKRYSSGGVMHLVAPDWLEDIRELIKVVEFLLIEIKKKE